MEKHIRETAEEMPEHQSSRGNEFRELSTDETTLMARPLFLGKVQANAPSADWSNLVYRYHMRRKRERYMHAAGVLNVDRAEARTIWWSFVHDSPPAKERKRLI